jgi:hypothetical protein
MRSPHHRKLAGLVSDKKKIRWAKKAKRATLGVALDQQTAWSVHAGPSSWNSVYLGFSRPGIQNGICTICRAAAKVLIVIHFVGSITQPRRSPTIDCSYTCIYIRTAIQLRDWGYKKRPQPYSEVEQHDACKGNRSEAGYEVVLRTSLHELAVHTYCRPAVRYTSPGAAVTAAPFIVSKHIKLGKPDD